MLFYFFPNQIPEANQEGKQNFYQRTILSNIESKAIIIIIKEFTKFTGNAMPLRTANLSCFIR